ncbi:cell surface protein [Bacillus manliponensis]|uniref:Cell surface protein n=1 Tax=Bacillus manliponensis TaxID=574376 RepID=A0A073JVS4_9BACI|nr:MupG family TIM beta-alpha barrel fold protein [Bacillus manliponensis]KEK19114.1 cell surface protein [Bacillus manliponensis]
MIGISIYLAKDKVKQQEMWIKTAKAHGFSSIFTSLHIPEDDPSTYKELLQILGQQARKYEMELMVDISPKSLHHLDVTYENVEVLLQWGITGLRVDYGISPKKIANLSHKMKIALNASTITEAFWQALLHEKIEVNHIEAWHNFYPRPETGLAKSFLQQQNEYLQKCGIKTMAFISGDGEKRGPLYEGLPTLEKHRNNRPLQSYLELVQDCFVDKVLIGDVSVIENTIQELGKVEEGMIPLRYKPIIQDQVILSKIERVHTNRLDPARDVVRSVESREYQFIEKSHLQPMNTMNRRAGAVTIDNQLYGRYAGEVQITKVDLPKHDKVNVIGYIIEEDIPLLNYIGAGKRFSLRSV